jgi:hypothetical protein
VYRTVGGVVVSDLFTNTIQTMSCHVLPLFTRHLTLILGALHRLPVVLEIVVSGRLRTTSIHTNPEQVDVGHE